MFTLYNVRYCLSFLYALVYGDINLFCLMFAYFILLCN